MTRYQRPKQQPVDPYRSAPLPVDRPAAVYYRQSSEGQIGNISTTLQTVDMIDRLLQQGWVRDSIYMIDMDAGISGTKKIAERPGMSMLHSLIENSQISLCAAQDVDRFFRDVTMIQTNIFIDACKRNDVRVMTPNVIYDFNHPTMGAYYMKMFREEAQRAADFLEYHIKGRLHRSRDYLSEQGLWAGRTVALGYMVDTRLKLPDGTKNPNWRKYAPFELAADIVRAYFETFRQQGRNFRATWLHIEQFGPFIPENIGALAPEGFKVSEEFTNRSSITGRLMPSKSGLHHLLTNAVYIGHWVHQSVITRWYNHRPIVREDVFMTAYNALSSTNFLGEPNADYVPYRPFNRHDKAKRACEPPIYGGLIFNDQLAAYDLRRFNSVYNETNQNYTYVLHNERTEAVMTLAAHLIDGIIDHLLLERLEATTIDEDAWGIALANTQRDGHSEVRRIEQEIRSAERAKQTILDNLKALSNPDIVKNLEASYEANEREIERLRAELTQLQSSDRYQRSLIEARPALQMIIAHWDDVPADKRRELFEAFAQRVFIRKIDMLHRQLVICWRDGTESLHDFTRAGRRVFWSPDELEKLKMLVESGAPQVEIMRAFPILAWKEIQKRYAYHFGNGGFAAYYDGETKYPTHFTWNDTEAAQAEQSAQLSVSIPPLRATGDYWGQHHSQSSNRLA